MTTIKRKQINNVSGEIIETKTYDCEDFTDAVEVIEKLRKADLARYTLLMTKYPDLFYDDCHNYTSYTFVVGDTEISCEIEDALEDACLEFLIPYQLNLPLEK